MTKFLGVLGIAWMLVGLAKAQTITLEDIYLKNTFQLRYGQYFRYLQNGEYFTNLENNTIWRYSIKTGQKVDVLFEQVVPWKIDGYELSPDEKKILIFTNQEYIYRHSFLADYYVYDIVKKTLTPLSFAGKQMNAQFSPDGLKIAFCRNNNLYIRDLETGEEIAITTDGKPSQKIHGMSDWVYEEEFGFSKAFFWSGDSKKIAFYTFDESHVKEYSMTIWNAPALYPQDYRFKYPKAGEQNAIVQIRIYNLETKQTHPISLGKETDFYIPRIVWTQNHDLLSITVLNRLQNKLEIFHYDLNTHYLKSVFVEESSTYIDINYCSDLVYLKDKKHFILSSEKSGYKHLYLFDLNGNLVRQLTSGAWEVVEFLGVNENSAYPILYYLSNEVSPLEQHLYSLSLDGKTKKKLTSMPGVHTAEFSPDFQYYVLRSSNTTTPLQVRLYHTKSQQLVKVLEENEHFKRKAQEFGFAPKEIFEFTNSENVRLYGWILKPKNFDSTRQYPLLIHVYGGPSSQMVRNEYGGSHFLWHQYLVQQGFIVACIDNRGTGGRGAAFKKCTYGILGKLELQDQIEAVRYLISQKLIDTTKIGIWGWSYGGYMAALCLLKASDIFTFGIAVAPVTSWRFYDTIYTERFLGKPQDNPAGYDEFSPLTHAHLLRRRFLLIHGTADDNVHLQHSIALQQALILAQKQFQVFYYPDSNHSLNGKEVRYHLYQQMANFVLQ
ncbi:MAG: S9 family peptidase [Cytophagales bacterium]|nr:S9 family peptidase [Cytophagales bacterium]MDW8384585.1 S9 family peptidase [Flammeovirgaceae bacterium]